jgi:hypothetical protein
MMKNAKWAPASGLQLLGSEYRDARWTVSAVGRGTARCPGCDVLSTRRHGSQVRHLQELPAQGTPVTLRVRLARWRCQNQGCERLTFSDCLPHVAAPYARRTRRVADLARLFGHVAGDRKAMAHLRDGGLLGMLVDQKLNEGLAVPFFGRPAMTTPALAQFALRFLPNPSRSRRARAVPGDLRTPNGTARPRRPHSGRVRADRRYERDAGAVDS